MNRLFISKTALLATLVFAFFLFAPVVVNAGIVPCGSPPLPACELCHLFVMIGRIWNLIAWQVVPAIATIMIIYTGIRFFTALGNPGELAKIKKMFIGIFAGLFFVILAWSITVILHRAMGRGGAVGWWEIPGCPL